MNDTELLNKARQIVHNARDNYIPPGPFLGGRMWSYNEADICMDIIKLVKDYPEISEQCKNSGCHLNAK